MKNPLSKIVPVDDRNDGVYITVPRLNKGGLSSEDILKVLDKAEVTNYDREKIENAITRARGAPQKIGPPFEYYNKAIDSFVDVSITGDKAVMKINPSIAAEDFSLTHTLVKYCLMKKGIRFGLLDKKIEDVVREKLYNVDVVIAQDEKPKPGRDARIVVEPECDVVLHKRAQRGSGTSQHTIIEVSKGQILARKKPATPGTAGRKINGDIIHSIPGIDSTLPQGENTVLVEDGLALAATKNGALISDGTLFTVSEQLIIQNDIDNRIGNIKFSGDIIIKGNVRPGLIVESEGDIEIEGAVESATVKSRYGNVTVKNGILGKGNTFVLAKKNVEVLFAQNASIEAEDTLRVAKHCLNCNCVCRVFECTHPESNVIGGKLRVTNYVRVNQIGNQKEIDTHVFLVDIKKGEAQEKLKEYTVLKEKVLFALDPVKKQVSNKAAIFKKAGDLITDRHRIEMKKWIDSYNMLNVKLKHIQEKIDSISNVIKNSSGYDGYIHVTGSIFPGTVLDMYGKREIIKRHQQSATYRINNNGEILMEG